MRQWLTGVGLIVCCAGYAANVEDYQKKPDDWFAGNEAKEIAARVLSWQAQSGGWPKNVDTAAKPYAGDKNELKPTFDNRATTGELRFLARMIGAMPAEAQYKEAFARGLEYILKAQYPTGGWPQFFPPGKGYHRHITFNDDAMVRLLEFLRDVATNAGFAFVADAERAVAQKAFDAGIQCILKCQIEVGGKLTAWCAQHDELDFTPRPARSFELTALSGYETVGIVRLLMSLEPQTPEVIAAIEAALAWLESAKLTGIKLEDREVDGRKDRVVVNDPNAKPLWARFYDIQTNQPIYADREGVAKKSIADIGHERRNGYAWLGIWPHRLLEDDAPAWRKRLKP